MQAKPATIKDDLDELPPLSAVGNTPMPLPSFFEVQWSSVRVCDQRKMEKARACYQQLEGVGVRLGHP